MKYLLFITALIALAGCSEDVQPLAPEHTCEPVDMTGFAVVDTLNGIIYKENVRRSPDTSWLVLTIPHDYIIGKSVSINGEYMQDLVWDWYTVSVMDYRDEQLFWRYQVIYLREWGE